MSGRDENNSDFVLFWCVWDELRCLENSQHVQIVFSLGLPAAGSQADSVIPVKSCFDDPTDVEMMNCFHSSI
ncbi:hypothetical protein HU200_019299 [Digitaria exilis]|uniref:Uncharacterized protein n=1 Tax=Digitaria exilis TaxID=1010633 RepID=A0A835F2X4_9POAL|nr:hypothetical protein HU200_019299 [Digitaria exilis]